MQIFLNRVLSENGHICVASPSQDFKGFQHFSPASYGAAEDTANKLITEGRDVYFAVGTLREKYIMENGKRKVRVGSNILELKSFFLDLDVGEAKAYKTQREAIVALKKFTAGVGLPLPLVVSSGYGVHVYWMLSEPLPSAIWVRIAAVFKSLTEAYGLHADPARTSDMSSVLRLPGTLNFKNPDDPQQVKILSPKYPEDIPPKTFVAIVAAASKAIGVVAKAPKQAQTSDAGFGSFEISHEPSDFMDIVSRCAQVGQAFNQQATVSNALWRHVLQLVRHCTDWETGMHDLSRGHPTYSHENTEAEMRRVEVYGPTICSTFDSTNPGVCAGCPHSGKITSPIQLGRILKEATDKPLMDIDHGGGETSTVELPEPPYPYIRTSKGGIAMRTKDKDGNNGEPELIYAYDIYPIKRMYDEVEQTEVMMFKSQTPQEGWRNISVPGYLIYDERKLLELLSRQGVYPSIANKSRLVGYMLGYIQALQKQMPAEQIYNQFGWRRGDTEILIGDRCYSENGFSQVKVNDQFQQVLSKFESKGTLDEWRKVINVYNHKGAEDYAFALMMGFGQLMFKFTGYEGALFNFYGDPGAGKSTVLKLIHSIYGQPTEKSLLQQDTTNAKLAVIGCYNNLPVTYDEITNIEPGQLSDLVYALSNGRGKEAMTQNRTLRANTATWQTIGYSTSNDSMSQLMSVHKGKASGETFRIMERHVKVGRRYTLNEARKIFDPLETNYGVAGPVIAEWLVRNQVKAKEMIQAAYREISDRVNGESPERFWLGMCATAIVGARLGKELGLHNYEPDWIMDHAENIINESRGVVVRDTKGPIDIVVEYMNLNVNKMLVTQASTRLLGESTILLKPMHGIVIRHDTSVHHLYITKNEFKAWCVGKHYDPDTVYEHLNSQGIMLNEHTTKSLGDGTEYATGRSVCLLLDSSHHSLAGVTKLSLVQQPEAEEKEPLTVIRD